MPKAYNPEIDFWKLFFAIAVFTFHSHKFLTPPYYFSRGHLGVEFFFYVSGYFLAAKIQSSIKKNQPAPPTDVFLKGKVQTILHPVFAGFVVCFTLSEIASGNSFSTSLKHFIQAIPEILNLRIYGFETVRFYNGPTWYISAMLVSMVLLYPLAKKYGRPFLRTACPTIALFGYDILNRKCESLGVGASSFDDLIAAGLIRGIAGIACGCFINECCVVLKEKLGDKKPTKSANVLFTVLEILLAGFIIFYMQHGNKTFKNAKKCDFMVIFFIAAFVFLIFSELTGIKNLLKNVDLSFMSKFSLYLYLSHRGLIRVMPGLIKKFDIQHPFIYYVSLTVAAIIIVRCIVELTTNITKRWLPALNQKLFKTPSSSDYEIMQFTERK